MNAYFRSHGYIEEFDLTVSKLYLFGGDLNIDGLENEIFPR